MEPFWCQVSPKTHPICLQDAQDEFIAETGLEFSFLFALFEGGSGNPATADDCAAYAETINNPSFPVFADSNYLVKNATPMRNGHPEMCALTPDMEIISCYAGHNAYENCLDDIKEHAGL